ncbi:MULTISPECIES: GTP 3',8-cyclase MoaA [unclassified Halorhodospira]|uniref:GTP 3',8-cyclase MoaA n=1 Tax=unclassified Halorhodospira TaxID=2626748 RepID=UPI001EE89CDA|nr:MULTISPECIES: GTP 3',8-cyclase MoaA [unclassified Halorhodospira]MCG5539744.1 GTP 3',8-cyclase MoaA [Halorhodospira sp. M39old]MCG5544806.1 GTP 3',8-cyclase MoaA [Halorhodospira sp. M38]
MSSDSQPLVDAHGRRIDYLRLSVTDRCDLRCLYCMGGEVRFVPRSEILSLEELEQVAVAVVGLGVRKVRITGGEPLLRRGVLGLARRLGAIDGLEELVMTTNATQLARYARELRAAGVQRLNISLDTLDADRFRQLTRTGRLDQVLEGIESARGAGFKRIRLNTVAMRGRNDDEILSLVDFALARGMDISFIEEMPFGDAQRHVRGEAFMGSAEVRSLIERRYDLEDAEPRPAAGPSRELQVSGSATRVGFISPHSGCFCPACNRVRVTVEGLLLPCLGDEGAVDLRGILRAGDDAVTVRERLRAGVRDALARKPARHGFAAPGASQPRVVRFMSATGG